MKSIFETGGGTYTKAEDYLLPELQVPKQNGTIGKYGRLHKKFIKENYPSFYSTLLTYGNLFDYLQKVDLNAQNDLNRLIPLLAEIQGITEQLKAENQLKWAGLMNNIKSQAEEIVYTDIVYKR